jgi:hypothetical protein
MSAVKHEYAHFKSSTSFGLEACSIKVGKIQGKLVLSNVLSGLDLCMATSVPFSLSFNEDKRSQPDLKSTRKLLRRRT